MIEWVRYEGSSRLYAVNIDNGSQPNGTQLIVLVSHENRVEPGFRVRLAITTTHWPCLSGKFDPDTNHNGAD